MNFNSTFKIDDSENEEDIELYAESEQILNFKNSMVDINLVNNLKKHDIMQESYKENISSNNLFIQDRVLNKNYSDHYLENNKNLKKEFSCPSENKGFKKLIKRKNSTIIKEEKIDIHNNEKFVNQNRDKINVHQSAMANQYNIKIGDIDLNDHFFKEKINSLEEENKNLREMLETVL